MIILLVEDNENISEALSFSLKKKGYEVLAANTLENAAEALFEKRPDLVLLDVMLPDGNGFDFYKRELMEKKTPTIFLTARDEEKDIVLGLDLGAEDYVTKPFSTNELLARINRVFMRINKESKVTVKGVTFDFDRVLVEKDGAMIDLSVLELKILQLLFTNHDKAVKRSDVIELIRNVTGNDVYDHTVTVYMKRIKDKLGVDIINTIKGVGYRIDTQE